MLPAGMSSSVSNLLKRGRNSLFCVFKAKTPIPITRAKGNIPIIMFMTILKVSVLSISCGVI